MAARRSCASTPSARSKRSRIANRVRRRRYARAYQAVCRTSRTHLHSVYLDEFVEAADKSGAVLTRLQTIPRIEAAFLMVTDPRRQQLLSDAIYFD